MSAWVSLLEANRLVPDGDFESTADNLKCLYGVDESERCLRLERVPLNGIDSQQRMDDELAVESVINIERLRSAILADQVLPPIYLAHHPGDRFPYFLLEGMHRFSAYLIAEVDSAPAWVAHVNCCRDLQDEANG